ncbi:DUF2806 domain-containing protein [Neorhizobium galegae]|uniref:DUF2806 domain-containing protein n=1 Tax=Neorhizobium galegae TaxID=399 RepID=UPI0021021A42|nr:DUF2806 domain-containing protein [Neorhizobium galegae]MCQ1779113.1 DUF2806 domain-containing protein [Neorhizobium galegae]MCQ1799212.1 DUF2806 domain-containing protein [Neorhizobium galegae]
MAKKDDDSIGIEVKWNWQNLSAKFRSRLLSAGDQRGATQIAASGLDVERSVALHRATTDAQLTLIAAATKVLSKKIANDPELAARALAVFTRAEKQTDNMEGAFALALEDLRNRPSNDDKDEGSDQLSPDFINRWERYAAEASTDQLREKWGRILSAEVRKPNTFSVKLLRILDEIDTHTAELFERFCRNRVGKSVPKVLLELTEHELRVLEEAELVLPEGLGFGIKFAKTSNSDGSQWWIYQKGDMGVVVRCDPLPSTVDIGRLLSKPLQIRGEEFSMIVIPLTSVGNALASILPDTSDGAFQRLAERIRGDDPKAAKFVRLVGEQFVEDEQEFGDL